VDSICGVTALQWGRSQGERKTPPSSGAITGRPPRFNGAALKESGRPAHSPFQCRSSLQLQWGRSQGERKTLVIVGIEYRFTPGFNG
ncbi:unnamed protein product, partial [Durusdinium trenchii]